MELPSWIVLILGWFSSCRSKSVDKRHFYSKHGQFEISESKFLDIQPFFIDQTQISIQCAYLCSSMEKCGAFNYDVKTHLCSLLPVLPENVALTPSPSHISGIMMLKSKQATKRSCRGSSCKADHLCVTILTGKGHICIRDSVCITAPQLERMVPEMGVMSLTSGQASYSCDTGYRRVNGSGNSACTDGNGWTTPTLVCTGIDCGGPPGRNYQNITSVNSTLFKAIAEYECDVGFNRTEGSGFSSCQANGNWSVPSQQCRVVDCGVPDDVEHMDKGEVTNTTYRSRVTFSCSVGFESDVPDQTIDCMANGTWSQPASACNRKDCGRPASKPNMTINVTTTVYESEATYGCAVGYNATGGNGTVVCLADATWEEPSLVCQIVNCGNPPSIENMKLVTHLGTTYQMTASFECATGYTPANVQKMSTCTADGTWSLLELSCTIVDCGAPRKSNSLRVSVEDTTYNSTAVYQCGLGFYVPGDGKTLCQADGEWSPLCEEIPGLRGTRAFPASSGAQLQCRNVISTAVYRSYPDDIVNARCDDDEILTGCSAQVSNSRTQMRGSWIWNDSQCNTRRAYGTQSIARCCKIHGIQCEYFRSEFATSLSCKKNFQLLDCACLQLDGVCYSTMINNTCLKHSTDKMTRYAVCCTFENLSCYVKEASDRETNGQLTTTCGSGETMTSCSGYNTDKEIQKSLIEQRSGVDTCVIHPGSSNPYTLIGYVSCCKYS